MSEHSTLSDMDSPDDAFADARQVQRIAERLWADQYPDEPFPALGNERVVPIYGRAKEIADA